MDINEAISIAFTEAQENDNCSATIEHDTVSDEDIEEWCEDRGYTITGSGYGFGSRDISIEYEDEDSGEERMINLAYEGLPNFR